jgi:hypothetical protein
LFDEGKKRNQAHLAGEAVRSNDLVADEKAKELQMLTVTKEAAELMKAAQAAENAPDLCWDSYTKMGRI